MKNTLKTFTVIYEPEKMGGFSVSVPQLPGCYSQGETLEEATHNIKEAIELYLEELAQDESLRISDLQPLISSVSVYA